MRARIQTLSLATRVVLIEVESLHHIDTVIEDTKDTLLDSSSSMALKCMDNMAKLSLKCNITIEYFSKNDELGANTYANLQVRYALWVDNHGMKFVK